METSDVENSSGDEEMDDLLEPEDLFNDEADDAGDDRDNDELKDEKTEEKPKKEKVVKKKTTRIGTRPRKQPNYDTLAGKNGLSAAKKLFQNFKFKGNGHEKEDLTKIMGLVQQWMCYQLCPRFDFESVMLELETLGKKKPIQVLLKKYRLGMDDWGEDKPNQNEETPQNTNEFDLLLQEDMEIVKSDNESEQTKQKEPEITLTQEQLERIARNRKLAEERRQKRMSEQGQAMEVSQEVEASKDQEISLDGITLEENN